MKRIGSRLQVIKGISYMTSGGLKKGDLKYNKQGKIVSKKMSLISTMRYHLNFQVGGDRSIDFVYNNLLNHILQSYNTIELNDTKWVDRIINPFLSEINGLLNWFGWDVYMYDFIPIKFKIESYIHIPPENEKFCGLFGANITYSGEDIEPHAFIIFKDSDSTDKYLFNGRGQIYVNQKDICDIRNDLQKINSVFKKVNIYKPVTAIQTRLDGLVIHNNNGTRTKEKHYKGLCFPICVVYAYMFLNTDSTFIEIDDFLLTKSNDELEILFLKMNNKLGIHD
jgi:hypothetical protein